MTHKNKIFYLIFCLLLSSCLGNLNIFSSDETENEVQTWLAGLADKTYAEKVDIASATWANDDLPASVRSRATYILASIYNEQSNIALQSLENQYKVAIVNTKIIMEETLYSDLQNSIDMDLKQLLGLVKPQQESIFPYSLLIYTAAKRNLLQNSPQIVAKLSSKIYFQSPTLTGVQISPDDKDAATDGAIAILLPRSGNIANISTRIISGIEAAKSHLQSQNKNWQVHYIDTTENNWVDQVKALPKDCITIGGPIQTANYKILKDNNLLSEYAVFAFIPRLTTPNEEGFLAWQFFSKPEDQINAVLNVASNQLGINSFGVFAPANSYGSSMDNLFIQIASSRGLLVESAFYPTDDIKSWANLSRDFLKADEPEDNKTLPEIKANFDAIFFPGPWKDMDQLISTMHYQGGHEKIMLGTLLWEQSLNQIQSINPSTFGLTIFPVAYEPNLDSELNTEFKELMFQMGIEVNDWSALGFDFLMMASQLGLTERLEAIQINARLQNLNYDAVSAPFQWDQYGNSHRQLFINQPARIGRLPFDIGRFVQYRTGNGDLPNQSPKALSDETLQNQEQEALDQVDDLIDEILAN